MYDSVGQHAISLFIIPKARREKKKKKKHSSFICHAIYVQKSFSSYFVHFLCTFLCVYITSIRVLTHFVDYIFFFLKLALFVWNLQQRDVRNLQTVLFFLISIFPFDALAEWHLCIVRVRVCMCVCVCGNKTFKEAIRQLVADFFCIIERICASATGLWHSLGTHIHTCTQHISNRCCFIFIYMHVCVCVCVYLGYESQTPSPMMNVYIRAS